MRRIALTVLLSTLTVLLAASSASAGIWNPVTSGLAGTDTIRAIDYQSGTRFWLATSTGKIATRQADASFTVTKAASATSFNDIAFKPGSPIGIAVGTNGNIWRSTNGGASWSQVNFTGFDPNKDCGADQNNPPGGVLPTVTNPAVSLDAVAWGPGNRVFVTGAKSTVLRSANDGASFTEINKTDIVEPGFPTYRQIACKQQGEFYDVIPLPADAGTANDALPLYFLVDSDVFYSVNGLTTTPAKRANLGCGGGYRNFVLDPFQPTHQWAATDRGSDSSCLYYTQDDANYNPFDVVNQGTATLHASTRIAAAGASPPTIVSVGKSGDILNGLDGQKFYVNRADGTLAQQDWYAVSGFDAANFAVGGAGGSLVVSSTANTIPDLVAPAGVVSGPATTKAGVPTTFTAAVTDEAGGSGVDPAGFSWSATGVPAATGQTVSLVFPAAGSYAVKVTFRDKAGNVAAATLSVLVTAATVTQPPVVTPPKPVSQTKTVTATVAGGTVTLAAPRACVPAGTSFTATLSFKKAKKKGAKFVKVSSVDFFVGTKKQGATDKKAPFTKKITVKDLKAGTKYTLKARATIKVKRGKSPKKSISTSFTVCG